MLTDDGAIDLGLILASLCLTLVRLIRNTLSSIFGDRKDKKKSGLHRTRSSLEAKVNIFRNKSKCCGHSVAMGQSPV
jgi:hypothetical protein